MPIFNTLFGWIRTIFTYKVLVLNRDQRQRKAVFSPFARKITRSSNFSIYFLLSDFYNTQDNKVCSSAMLKLQNPYFYFFFIRFCKYAPCNSVKLLPFSLFSCTVGPSLFKSEVTTCHLHLARRGFNPWAGDSKHQCCPQTKFTLFCIWLKFFTL